MTPALRRVVDAAKTRADAEAARRARLEEKRRAANARFEAERQERWRRQADWERSADRKWILHHHQGQLPRVITSTSDLDLHLADELEEVPERWKGRVYRRIATAGHQLEWRQVAGILASGRPSSDRRLNLLKEDWKALSRFVQDLADQGLIAYEYGRPTLVGPAGMALVRRDEDAELYSVPSLPVVPAPPVSPRMAEGPAGAMSSMCAGASVGAEPIPSQTVSTAEPAAERNEVTESSIAEPVETSAARVPEPTKPFWRRILGRVAGRR